MKWSGVLKRKGEEMSIKINRKERLDLNDVVERNP